MTLLLAQHFGSLFSTFEDVSQAEDMRDNIVCWLFEKITDETTSEELENS